MTALNDIAAQRDADNAAHATAEQKDIDNQMAQLPLLIYRGDAGDTRGYAFYAPARRTVKFIKPEKFTEEQLTMLAPLSRWCDFYREITGNPAPEQINKKNFWRVIALHFSSLITSPNSRLCSLQYDPDSERAPGIWRDTIDGTEGTLYNTGTDCFFIPDPVIAPTSPRRVIPYQHTFIYRPHAAPLPSLSPKPLTAEESSSLISFFTTRSWRNNHELYGTLTAGWLYCSLFASALSFRPQIWITGDKGTGKTTLLDDIRCILGKRPNSLSPWLGIEVENVSGTSVAGLRQLISGCPVPIFFDEIESNGNQKIKENIEALLAIVRTAATNIDPKITKGSIDGTPVTFSFRNCFCLASIIPQINKASDESRIIELPLAHGDNAALKLLYQKQSNVRHMLAAHDFPSRFLTRCINTFPTFRLNVTTLSDRLSDGTRDARSASRMAHFLAGAHALRSDAPMSETNLSYALDLASLFDASTDTIDEVSDILHRLFSPAVPTRGSMRDLRQIAAACLTTDATNTSPYNDDETLASYGMFYHRIEDKNYIGVYPKHPRLRALFRDTPWGDRFHLKLSEGCNGINPNHRGIIYKKARVPFSLSPQFTLFIPKDLLVFTPEALPS